MKTKKILIAISILMLVLSCNKEEDNHLLGIWADNIGLSQKDVHFDSSPHEVTITAQLGGFWITGIYFNQMAVDLGDVDISKPNFTLNTSEFQLKRINGNTLVFTMTENTSGTDRRLLVTLQSGDYFDGVNIYQSK